MALNQLLYLDIKLEIETSMLRKCLNPTMIHKICLFVHKLLLDIENQTWHTGTSLAPGGSHLYQI